MNILVTGGTGFVGSHLIRALLKVPENTVTCFIRPSSNTRWLKEQEPETGPKTRYRYDFENVDHYDTIYHIAGVLGHPKVSYSDYWWVHVDMTRKLIKNMGPSTKFIYMSSAWALEPEKPYEWTKVEGEDIVRALCENYSIIRPGFVYGPRDMHLLPIFKAINHLGRFFPIMGNGKNLICPTYVGDVVNCLLHALPGEHTVVGARTTMNEFIKTIAEELGRGKPFIHLPPVVKRDFFARERVFHSSESKWTQTKLRDGIKETVSWYRVYHCL